jgi:hypothetical protein
MPAIILSAESAYSSMTRRELRRLVGADVAGELFLFGAVMEMPAPTPDQFSLEEFVDTGTDSSRFTDFWVLIGGEERRLTMVNPLSGEATLHRPLGSAPDPGTVVEVYRWQPSLFNQAINDGLSRCKYVQWVELNLDSGESEYDLSALPYVLTKADVYGAYTRYNDDQSEVPWSDLVFGAGSRTLRILPTTYGTGTSLWLKVKRSYGPLNADTDTVQMPELWARHAARLALFKMLLNRTGAGKENAWMRGAMNLAQTDFRRESELHQPRESRKIQLSKPVWGPSYI